MKKITIPLIGLCSFALLLSNCQSIPLAANKQEIIQDTSWKQNLKARLPLLGHRNWILIVDKAYPAPSSANITVMNTGQTISEVAKQLDSLLNTEDHIRPIVHQDEELSYIDEQLVPGVDAFKKEISTIFTAGVQVIPHASIFKKIDDASKLFHIIVLKTTSVLPYTSLFIELDCKYWDINKEQELRNRIRKDNNQHELLTTKK